MAESNAQIGYGTLLERRTSAAGASPEVWQLIAERTNISGPGFSRDAPDVTHMDSPGGWREFTPGLKDAGEFSVEGNFVPSDASQNSETGLLSEFSSDVKARWRLTFPDGSPATVWEFDGILTGFEPSMPVDDKMGFSATMKVTGQPDLSN